MKTLIPASCCSRCAALQAVEACRKSSWRSSAVSSRNPWSNGVVLGRSLHLRLGLNLRLWSSWRRTPWEKSSGSPVSSSIISGLGESGGYGLPPSPVGSLWFVGLGGIVRVLLFFLLGVVVLEFRQCVIWWKCDPVGVCRRWLGFLPLG